MYGIHPRRMSDEELLREAQHTPNAMIKELARRLAAAIDEVEVLNNARNTHLEDQFYSEEYFDD